MSNTNSLFILACLLFLLAPITARSEDVLVGPDVVHIPIPEGYCLMNATEPSDNRLIEFLKEANENVNEVLLVFADCTQLQSWRDGELPDLNDFGYVLTPSSLLNEKLEMGIDSFLSEIRNELENAGMQVLLEEALENAEAVSSKHAISVELNETKSLGVLRQDDKAIYFGMLQSMQTEEGKSKKSIGLLAATLLDRKYLVQYLWKKYQGAQTVSDLEELTSSWVSDTHSANLTQ